MLCLKLVAGTAGLKVDNGPEKGAAVSGKEISVVLAVWALGASSLMGF